MKKILAQIKQQPFFIRLLHWEYWSANIVYAPVFPVFLWYCLKARSFFFFSTSNPTIKNAGLLMEGKYDIDAIVPPAYRPASLYFEPGSSFTQVKYLLEKNNFEYPLILKPNIGGKGVGVHKLADDEALKQLLPLFPVAFIVQPFVDLLNEIGLFYVKIPGNEKGQITGIVRKEFLKVKGDGINNVEALLQQNSRYILQIPALKKMPGGLLEEVLPAGEEKIVVPFGNHARGSLFIDDSHLVNQQLEDTFNEVCGRINGFYYGRLDIRYNSWEELCEGKNFSIIELNGAGSEPTHIYDPNHSLFFAWKEIIRHWKLLWLVSQKNKERNKTAYMNFSAGLQMLLDNNAYAKKMKKAF